MYVGDHRYIYFRVADSSGTSVAGLTKASFTIIFTRNNLTCADVLTFTDLAGGLYSVDYSPSVAGTDYLDIYEPTTKTRATFTKQIQSVDALAIVNDATNALLRPAGSLNPQNYILYAYLASDWSNGNRTLVYTKGSTALNPNGTWQIPFYLVHGTYTFVLTNSTTTIVLANNLSV